LLFSRDEKREEDQVISSPFSVSVLGGWVWAVDPNIGLVYVIQGYYPSYSKSNLDCGALSKEYFEVLISSSATPSRTQLELSSL
jgi:hypothetical protein